MSSLEWGIEESKSIRSKWELNYYFLLPILKPKTDQKFKFSPRAGTDLRKSY